MSVCLESSRTREGLKLPLDRSISEPGPSTPTSHSPSSPPKRFKLETSTSQSLPTSPCGDSGTIKKNWVLNNIKTLGSDDLKAKIEHNTKGSPFIIIDTRPFINYNTNHIHGAINVNCTDRFNRRRLQQGKATLADLATTPKGKEVLKKRCFREVIIYDDCTCDKEGINQPLLLVFTSLVEDQKEPSLLVGESRRRFCFPLFIND